MVKTYKESEDAAIAVFKDFLKKDEQKQLGLRAYLEKYRIIIKGESVHKHTFSSMIACAGDDENVFNIKTRMRATIRHLYGRVYLRHSFFINYGGISEYEIFLQINITDIRYVKDVYSALLYSNLYLSLWGDSEGDELFLDIEYISNKLLNENDVFQNIIEESDTIRNLNKELRQVKDQRNEFFEEKERLSRILKKKLLQPNDEKQNADCKKPVCYIMVDEHTNYTKIGFSVSPEKRERTLQAEKPTIKLIHIFEENHERHLHNEFSHKRVRGEWFNLTEKEVQKIIKKYK